MINRIVKTVAWLMGISIVFFFCACQTDFSKPADYSLDVNSGANRFVPELSVIELPGDSQAIVFEITNKGGAEREYTLSVSSFGVLPLVFELDTEQAEVEGANAVGKISGGAKHRYTLFVSWPAEENSYIYAGLIDKVSVTLNVEK